MPSPSPTTAELLLDILELTGLSATTPRQLTTDLRDRYVGARGLSARVKGAIDMLEAEGLVEGTSHLGRRLVQATGLGLETLEQRGRYPNGATVLFTDLVGSTALIGAHGEDEAHALRLRHFGLLRAAVMRHGGREVKGLGDGLMIVFRTADAAVRCAAEMQRSVQADEDGLGLRVGLHIGPLLREDDDFHGTTVIVAARLCDRCETGQVLLSGDVRDAAGDAAAGAEFVGDLALKGLERPVPTYALP